MRLVRFNIQFVPAQYLLQSVLLVSIKEHPSLEVALSSVLLRRQFA